MDGLPMEVREFMRTSLTESHLSEADPVNAWLLLMAYFLEGPIQRRARRRLLGMCLFWALFACLLTGFGAAYYGRWQALEEMRKGHVVLNIKSDKAHEWEDKGAIYLHFE